VCILGVLVCELRAGDQISDISVTVTIKDQLGQPIVDIPIGATGSMERYFGITNASGVAVLNNIAVDPDEERIYIFLASKSGRGPEYYQADLEMFYQITNNYGLADIYTIELVENELEYALDITAFDAITANGKLVTSLGAPIDAGLFARDAPRPFDGNEDGTFAVSGIPKGFSREIFVLTEGNEVHSIKLSPLQTLNDIDLGDVVITDATVDSPVRITVSNADDLDERAVLKSFSIVLVAYDGSVILQLTLNAAGQTMADAFTEGDPVVPEGTYYIAPGPIAPNGVAWELLDLIRAGQVDLDAAGVVKIEALSGQLVSLAVDAVVAETAILNAE
jgi:hypothetical protein